MAKAVSNLRAPPHSEGTIYAAWVLWLIGRTEPEIAYLLGKKPKQIAGIVTRSPYRNRSAMTIEARQAHLDELIAVRVGDNGKPLDGGILDKFKHRAIPLRGKQRRRGSD